MKTLRWDAVYGQRAAVASLKGALQRGRIGHAYLFSGPPGVGRRLTATVFAAALLCRGPGDGERPCGRCEECLLVARGGHPDLYRLVPEEDKILIDQVRALQRRASLTAVRSGRKVFVVEGVHVATEQAQNALLKVLEEPTGDAVFVLIADEGAPPLPTIVSRCFTVRFGPLSREDGARVLRERFHYGDAAPLAAALGGGSVALARETTPEGLLERRRVAWSVLRDVVGRPSAAAVQTETWFKKGEELPLLVDLMELYVRDVALCQQVPEAVQRPESWLVNFDEAEAVASLARSLPPEGVLRALDGFVDFRRRLAQNVGLRAALTVLFLDLAAAGRRAVS